MSNHRSDLSDLQVGELQLLAHKKQKGSMKPCVGCRNLVGFGAACKGGEMLTRIEDSLTGRVSWRDLRFTDSGGWRPSPHEMRKEGGRCGPERKLYQPKLVARLLPWMYS